MPKKVDGEFWFCDSKGEVWDLELHDETPCDEQLRLYGVGAGTVDEEEHALCGPCQIQMVPSG